MEISTVWPTTATWTWRRLYLAPNAIVVSAEQTLPELSTRHVTEGDDP